MGEKPTRPFLRPAVTARPTLGPVCSALSGTLRHVLGALHQSDPLPAAKRLLHLFVPRAVQ